MGKVSQQIIIATEFDRIFNDIQKRRIRWQLKNKYQIKKKYGNKRKDKSV